VIITLVLTYVQFGVSMYDQGQTLLQFFIMLANLPFFIIVFLGWAELGRRFRKPLLKDAAYASMALFIAIMVVSFAYLVLRMQYLSTYTFALSGIISIFLGAGILGLSGKLGSLARSVGILEIIGGIAAVSIVFVLASLVLAIPIAILESVLFLRAYRKVR
jgi:hypothetical protein